MFVLIYDVYIWWICVCVYITICIIYVLESGGGAGDEQQLSPGPEGKLISSEERMEQVRSASSQDNPQAGEPSGGSVHHQAWVIE